MSARVHVLHTGYVREDGVSSTVTLVLDVPAVIVVDPGMVADRSQIIGPLLDHGFRAGDVTQVVLTHHHPDHALNAGLFASAEVVDCWARYRGDQWVDHEGDGHRVSDHTRLILTPGHTAEDLTFLVETDAGVVACTHAWWRDDRTPELDPLAEDQAALDVSRTRILAEADVVIPGHGGPFQTGRQAGPVDEDVDPKLPSSSSDSTNAWQQRSPGLQAVRCTARDAGTPHLSARFTPDDQMA